MVLMVKADHVQRGVGFRWEMEYMERVRMVVVEYTDMGKMELGFWSISEIE